ncbi:alpha-ketoglutarate-dependent sulfonate [Moniliophthora roreri MCA 2997]|uniref:Alpha-ketoglutarate-dependent sulfonate n=1 Tax=Moniliophthora roreri (strain MCA 2997) TaxID=1381753 RepID=V2XEZ3_MONRO|nr:alpha-ketoglutarate-dependent sulfonate [Moniliophthora roreri MCA 2997]
MSSTAPLYPAYLSVRPEGPSASIPHPAFDVVEPGTRAKPSKPRLFAHPELRLKNLTPQIGTELRGIQLTKLNEEELDEVALLAAERGVLRDQDLKDAGFQKQRTPARHFGLLHRHASMGYPAGTSPEFHVIYADEQREYPRPARTTHQL